MRDIDRDLIRGGHYGQRSCEPRNRPNTWAHRPICIGEESPCQLGAVHTWGDSGRNMLAESLSAFGPSATLARSKSRSATASCRALCAIAVRRLRRMKGDRDQKASQPWSISSGIDPRLEAMTGVLLASASSASAEARLHCLNVCARPSWQTDREYRPLARLTRRGHVAAHHACKLARDGESEAGAAEALRGRGIGLRELVKQLAHLLRRHADAAICHGKLD